jgi:hypothetical protein
MRTNFGKVIEISLLFIQSIQKYGAISSVISLQKDEIIKIQQLFIASFLIS